jgi:ATP phosphoribosyltransferase
MASRLRLAIPKGKLFDKVFALLCARFEVTLDSDRSYRPLFARDNISAKIFKPRAIPQLLAMKKYDVGFCGFDLMEEYSIRSGIEMAAQVKCLDFNEIRVVVAVPSHRRLDFLSNPPKRPLIIATEYPNIADQWALKRGLAHIILQTWGSTEGYAPEDADIIIDCCETGATMAANGLREIETILYSSTCIFSNCACDPRVIEFLNRIEG